MNMKGQYHFPTTTGFELVNDNGKSKSGRRARSAVLRPGASPKSKSRGVEVYISHPFLPRNFGVYPSEAMALATKPRLNLPLSWISNCWYMLLGLKGCEGTSFTKVQQQQVPKSSSVEQVYACLQVSSFNFSFPWIGYNTRIKFNLR